MLVFIDPGQREGSTGVSEAPGDVDTLTCESGQKTNDGSRIALFLYLRQPVIAVMS